MCHVIKVEHKLHLLADDAAAHKVITEAHNHALHCFSATLQPLMLCFLQQAKDAPACLLPTCSRTHTPAKIAPAGFLPICSRTPTPIIEAQKTCNQSAFVLSTGADGPMPEPEAEGPMPPHHPHHGPHADGPMPDHPHHGHGPMPSHGSGPDANSPMPSHPHHGSGSGSHADGPMSSHQPHTHN